MAFLNRVGNALKQTVSKHVVSQLPTSNASLFQAMRCMSTSSKLFVGGLSYSTDEMSLREAFAQYGEVVEARIITDRETGRSRGFGFVTFTSSEEASSAIQAFDGQDLHGRRIRVNHATEKPRGGGFGGGFGGGGYGGQGNYGGGGYQGGNYQGGGGGYSSDNQYPSRGGGYGSPPSGGAGGYGGGDSLPADGNYSGGASNYSGAQASFSSILNDVTTGPREPLGDLQDGIDDGKEDFEDTLDENRDDNEEPNDYANTRS